jgi:hypothetical protein
MEVDPELKDAIKEEVAPIVGSVAAAALVAAAGMALMTLMATNYKSSSLTGEKEIHPTVDKTSASKSEVAASEKEGALDSKGVAAQSGEVKASNTDAAAQTGEAKAADSGASALRTKAGASDIETKALKMT